MLSVLPPGTPRHDYYEGIPRLDQPVHAGRRCDRGGRRGVILSVILPHPAEHRYVQRSYTL